VAEGLRVVETHSCRSKAPRSSPWRLGPYGRYPFVEDSEGESAVAYDRALLRVLATRLALADGLTSDNARSLRLVSGLGAKLWPRSRGVRFHHLCGGRCHPRAPCPGAPRPGAPHAMVWSSKAR
jgi:hypothetical protein